jgi:hypothetical protein
VAIENNPITEHQYIMKTQTIRFSKIETVEQLRARATPATETHYAYLSVGNQLSSIEKFLDKTGDEAELVRISHSAQYGTHTGTWYFKKST